MSRQRLRLTLALIGVMAVGCASAPIPPPVARADLDAFINDLREKIAADPELRFVVLRVSDPTPGSYGLQAVLRVNSREWAALPRRERDRLVRKASMLMLESFRPIQRRAPPETLRTVCTMRLLDERDSDLGYIIVGGIDPDNISYQITR